MNREVNGKHIEYGDCIVNRVSCTFSWRDRIRIFFGKEAHVSVRNYVKHEASIIDTETDLRVDPIVIYTFPPEKPKQTAIDPNQTCFINVPLRTIKI